MTDLLMRTYRTLPLHAHSRFTASPFGVVINGLSYQSERFERRLSRQDRLEPLVRPIRLECPFDPQDISQISVRCPIAGKTIVMYTDDLRIKRGMSLAALQQLRPSQGTGGRING